LLEFLGMDIERLFLLWSNPKNLVGNETLDEILVRTIDLQLHQQIGSLERTPRLGIVADLQIKLIRVFRPELVLSVVRGNGLVGCKRLDSQAAGQSACADGAVMGAVGYAEKRIAVGVQQRLARGIAGQDKVGSHVDGGIQVVDRLSFQ